MTRVLVVEDEESYSDPLAYLLRKEGYDVAVAATGQEALAEFDRNGADIILLDLMLPGLPGTEVCRQIRATSNVPVIMVSAKDDEVDKVVGLELGADDYVCKPYSPREVVARVKAVLRRAQGDDAPDRNVTLGDIHIEPAARQVTKAGEEVELTRLEFDLLYELASHPRVVYSRERLLERVWGYQSAVGAKTVDVHVANLRRKLGDDIPLVAVRGVGYKIEPPR